MNYLSLFTGIGGFELGFQQAYEEKMETINRSKDRRGKKDSETNDEKQKRLVAETCEELNAERGRFGEHYNFHSSRQEPPTCIGYSEIDKYAIQIFERHFPNIRNFGDCKRIREEELPDFELVCGGFPCQSFSIAGKRGGFEDTRGTLFFDIARIIKAKRPRLVFLENVKGLLSHDDGRTFNTIILTLDELGYDIQWQVLNSKNFGVPQNRERVFIIGHSRGTPRPKVFPFGESSTKIKVNVIGTTKSETAKGTNSRSWVHDVNGIVGAVNATEYKQPKQIIQPYISYNTHSQGKRYHKKMSVSPALAVNSESDRGLLHKDSKIRRLTPTECERLQGFPDGWTEGISDTQRYKMLGNAVTMNVIREIAKRLI